MGYLMYTSQSSDQSFFPVTEKHCVKFYHPERRDGQLHVMCRNQHCVCAEGKHSDNTVQIIFNQSQLVFVTERWMEATIDWAGQDRWIDLRL